MTDPDTIARGIADVVASLFNIHGYSRQDAENMDAVIKEIATALREYGEAEYGRGQMSGWQDRNVISMDAHNHRLNEADAEGYYRGRKDVFDLWEKSAKQRGQDGGK